MSKVEMVVWCAVLVAALVIGCREERQLILREEELMKRLEEPLAEWPAVDAGFAEESGNEG